MHYAACSRDPEVAIDLLNWFVSENLPDCFAACLFQCYDLLSLDVVMEYAWRNDFLHMAMPFLIQRMKELSSKVSCLWAFLRTLHYNNT